MQKFAIYSIVAIIFAVLGFSFAKFCPLGIKLGPAKAQAFEMSPSERQLNSSLMSALLTARSVIEGYKRDHNDTYPEFAKYGWKQVTYKTNSKGQISERGKELANASFGPYFASPPQNPLTKSSEVLVVPNLPENFKATGSYGFVFAEDTGKFFALNPDGTFFDDATANR